MTSEAGAGSSSDQGAFEAWAWWGLDGEAQARASRDLSAVVLALTPALALMLAGLLHGPIRQAASYHHFADDRTLLGIAHGLNVVSNLPFAIIGGLGLCRILLPANGLSPALRLCYGIMFGGIACTSIGSAYYHLMPDGASLVWDRLPMAVAFMGLFAGFLTERLELAAATSMRLLAGLLGFGLVSVLTWYCADDLRLYAIAQFYPVLAIPPIIGLTRAQFTRSSDWLAAIGIYVVAKIFEEADGLVYLATGAISGHTIKHLVAAFGAWWLYRMLSERQPTTE